MDLRIDPTSRDLLFIGGALSFVEGIDACEQRIRIKLRFFLKEWFLDTTKGIDWFNVALVKNADQGIVDNMILVQLTDDPDVISVLNYGSSFNSIKRELSITFKLQTVYGILNLTEIREI